MKHFAFPVLAVILSIPTADATSRARGFDLEAVPASFSQTCVELIASQLDSVGQVCATVEENELVVLLVAAEGYRLAETHLAVGSSLEGIPRSDSGMPQIGRFPYKTTHTPLVSEVSYRVPLEELGSLDTEELFIAAHASMMGADDAEQGAWAAGPRFREQGSPATYFKVVVGG